MSDFWKVLLGGALTMIGGCLGFWVEGRLRKKERAEERALREQDEFIRRYLREGVDSFAASLLDLLHTLSTSEDELEKVAYLKAIKCGQEIDRISEFMGNDLGTLWLKLNQLAYLAFTQKDPKTVDLLIAALTEVYYVLLDTKSQLHAMHERGEILDIPCLVNDIHISRYRARLSQALLDLTEPDYGSLKKSIEEARRVLDDNESQV